MVAAPKQEVVVGTCIPLAALAVAPGTHVAPSEDTWEVQRAAQAAQAAKAAEAVEVVSDAWVASQEPQAVSSLKPLVVFEVVVDQAPGCPSGSAHRPGTAGGAALQTLLCAPAAPGAEHSTSCQSCEELQSPLLRGTLPVHSGRIHSGFLSLPGIGPLSGSSGRR